MVIVLPLLLASGTLGLTDSVSVELSPEVALSMVMVMMI